MADPDLRALLAQAHEGFGYYALPADHPAAKRSANPYTANEMKSRIEAALTRVPADRRVLMRDEIARALAAQDPDDLLDASRGDGRAQDRVSQAILDAIDAWL